MRLLVRNQVDGRVEKIFCSVIVRVTQQVFDASLTVVQFELDRCR